MVEKKEVVVKEESELDKVKSRLREIILLSPLEQEDAVKELAKTSGRKIVRLNEQMKVFISEKKDEEEEDVEDEDETFIQTATLTYKTKYGIKVHIPNATKYIMNNFDFNFKTVWHKAGETVYSWNGKLYNASGKEIIKTKLEELTSIHCRSTDATEVFEKIKRKTATPKEAFDVDRRYINFSNGVYDIFERKLVSHNPSFLFRNILELVYDPTKDCPTFKKFITEAMYPEDIPVMQEFYGFCLFRNYFIKKGAICVGPKDTGKTLNQKVLIKFVGEENKCGLSLQKISSGNNFAKIAMKDKLLNAYDDLSSEDLGDGGGFKLATGGGFISAEEKFGDTCEFKSFAKQFFCCNKIPPVKDNNDPAYYDRWLIFQFDNVPDKIDPFLFEKMTTQDELSGILNWALEGLGRLLQNSVFSYKKDADQIKVIMERSGNVLGPFVQDVLVKDENSEITKEAMYELYSEYMKDKDFQKLSKEQLGRRLGQVANFIQSKRDSDNRYWKGAKVSQKYENVLNKFLQSIKNDNNDTLDTSSKFIGNIGKNKNTNEISDSPYKDMLCEKASQVSPTELKGLMEDME
jgi:putative DNA primase/helicase